jgi:RHS repeat-associated protein
MKRIVQILTVVVSVGVAAHARAACDPHPQARKITGTVTIADGTTPPADSRIEVFAHCTGLNFDYSVGILPGGGGSMTIDGINMNTTCEYYGVNASGYLWSDSSVTASCTADTPPPNEVCGNCQGTFNIQLYGASGSVDGTVVTLPLRVGESAQASVCLYSPTSASRMCSPTDVNGNFDFRVPTEPGHSNHWGVPISRPMRGSTGAGAEDYIAFVDEPEGDKTTVTVRSSKRATAVLGRLRFYVMPPEMRCPARRSPSARVPNTSVGRPVNVLTGNVWFDHTDAVLPAVGGTLSLTRSYNSRNAVANIGGGFGRGWTHTYETRLSLPEPGVIELRGSDGVPIYFSDADGDLTYVGSVPLSEESTIVQAGVSPNRTFTRRFPAGGSEVYSDGGTLLSATDASGNLTTFGRDSAGRLAVITSGARSLSLGYDSSSRIASLSGPVGPLALYSYDSNGFLQRVTYPDGSGYTFTYDAIGEVLSVIDLAGRVVETHTYGNGRGLTASHAGDDVEKLTLSYDDTNHRTTVTDILGHVTTYDWKSIQGMRQVTKIVGACSGCGGSGSEVQEWTYDAKGQVIAYKDEAGVTTYTYDDRGNLLTLAAPAVTPGERTTAFSYDAANRVLTVARPIGTTTYTHGPNGPLTVTNPMTKTTAMVYGGLGGRVSTVTDPRGKSTTISYNSNGDLVSISDPLTHATTFGYDAMGRRTTVTDALGHTTTTTYDVVGRVARVTAHDGTHTDFGYDKSGARSSVTDPLGRVTRYGYDVYGRLERVVDAIGGATTYTYDKMSHVVSLKDAKGQTTAFEYDTTGRLKKTTHPGGLFETFTYDTAGRLSTKTDRKNVTTTFAYDVASRLVGKTYSDGSPAVTYSYDKNDRLLTAVNDVDTLTWTYDAADEMLTEHSEKNASNVAYTYDDAGHRLTLSLDGSLFVSYGYDDASRLTSISRGANVFSFSYDSANRRTSMGYPNGVSTAYAYDNLDGVLSIIATKGTPTATTTVSSSAYTYDAAGNRITKTHPEYAETYGYDALYRLTTVDRIGIAKRQRYIYDTVGNRLSQQADDNITSYSYNNLKQLLSTTGGGTLRWSGTLNEPGHVQFTKATINGQRARMLAGNTFEADIPVTAGSNTVALVATDKSSNTTTKNYSVSVSGTAGTMTYDANGNLITNGTISYEWDAENRLARVRDNGVELAHFKYDALGRRVEKTAGGAKTAWLHAGAGIFREARGSSVRTYVYGPGTDQPLAHEEGATVAYYHAEGLGSIVAATDAGGDVTSHRRYDAWGNLEVAAAEPGYAFTGREWDPETGLYYYRARYYDPKVGRFISEDPIGFAGGLNFYGYVGSNPINYRDPFGLFMDPASREAMGRARDAAGPGWNPWNSASAAVDQANRMFPPPQGHPHDTGWNDPNDAIRHCVWNCLMSQSSTAEARLASRVREASHDWSWSHPQETGERAMDDHNNACGRRASQYADSPESCARVCQQSPLIWSYQNGSTGPYW